MVSVEWVNGERESIVLWEKRVKRGELREWEKKCGMWVPHVYVWERRKVIGVWVPRVCVREKKRVGCGSHGCVWERGKKKRGVWIEIGSGVFLASLPCPCTFSFFHFFNICIWFSLTSLHERGNSVIFLPWKLKENMLVWLSWTFSYFHRISVCRLFLNITWVWLHHILSHRVLG